MQLLSRKIWEKVIEPKNAFSLLIEEKRLWCFQGRMWGLCIQLITLAESDSMMKCWWWRRQLDVDSSMALTIALNSAILESKIPTGTENIPRRWPWWFCSTPPSYSRGAWLTKRRAIYVPFEAINHRRRPHIINFERVSIGPPKQAICRSDQICRGVWEIRMDSF